MFLAALRYQPPTDDYMIRHFHEHEEEFEALLEQVDEWPDNTLNLDWEQRHSSYVPPLDDSRIEEMRNQFGRLGIIRISVEQRWINDALTVYINSYDSGEQKGYAYLADPNWQEVYDENLNRMDVYDKLVFRHIKDNWFLYLMGKQSE